ncbi:MAG: hypothetical protein HOE99_12755 [Acidiferrobacteraceae bacterium]|nr:hypothetical protein [Acidiferrobacteraceae bacterium]MBT4394604.1 hypothetical protein [Acidiferrobacteraceae bacterium]
MTHSPANQASQLWARDPALWSSDSDVHPAIADRLGWLDSPQWLADHSDRLTRWAQDIHERGFTRAVLIGMGGSSLAAEVLSKVFGPSGNGLSLTVLDNTHPDAVRSVLGRQSWARILFIFSSKSGTTAEVQALCTWVLESLEEQGVAEPGAQCIAITDANSPLADLAIQRHFHDCLLNPTDIGGRFAALTAFAMAPAALMGIELKPLADSAMDMAQRCHAQDPLHNPGLALGEWLAEHWQSGRDCLQLWFDDDFAPLAAWIEQLVAESTGKAGKGILPLDRSHPGAPAERLVRVAIGGAADTPFWQEIQVLAQDGVPLRRIEIESAAALGGEFFRWAFAVAIVGAAMGVNPFDEPNVNASKQATRDLLAGDVSAGSAEPGALGGLAQCLHDASEGSYFSILAYVPPEPAVYDALESFAQAVRERYGLPVSINVGPRYLHSTGQLHKGGPASGIFLFVSLVPEQDLAIFCEDFSFGELNRAQAIGDCAVLLQRGRPVFAVDVFGEPSSCAWQLRDKLHFALNG